MYLSSSRNVNDHFVPQDLQVQVLVCPKASDFAVAATDLIVNELLLKDSVQRGCDVTTGLFAARQGDMKANWSMFPDFMTPWTLH